MDNSINNNIHIAKQNPADNPNAVSSQKSYDAQQSLDKSIFGINDKKLNNDTKKCGKKALKT